jgi:drug/metabolite transporter (DMT)-like permease
MARLWSNAWLLLALANLFWAGNIIVGRAVAADIPPFAFTLLRWTGGLCLALAAAWSHLPADWPVLRRHWKLMLVMATFGFAAFNTMSYRGMRDTTALNAVLMQSAMPLVVLLWMFVLFRERPRPLQVIGVAVSIAGVAAIASHGSLATLARLALNPGDVWILAAISFYALYAALLRRRPAVHTFSFIAVAFAIATLMLIPGALWEYAEGERIRGGSGSALAILYTMIFPSFLSTLLFNRGVELIGPGRGGQSAHLIPVFGSVMAVLFLGEVFRGYHAVGIGLIALGIVLASVRRPVSEALRPIPNAVDGRTRSADT